MLILPHSRFNAARGGHAPGDLREAFVDAVEVFMRSDDRDPQPVVTLRGQKVTLDQLAGLLWNCTDIMPVSLRGDIGVLAEQVTDEGEHEWRHHSRTYSQGARLVRLYAEARRTNTLYAHALDIGQSGRAAAPSASPTT